MNPQVSIIIPLYNKANYIAETIESALLQTYRNKEIIVVDDGSSDNSIQIVSKLIIHNSNIKLIIRRREPKGASTCRNIGIQHSVGEYIIFLDADDILAPYCLAQRINLITWQKELDFGVFLMQYFKNKPNDIQNIVNTLSNKDDISSFLSLDIPWPITSVIWKKESLCKLNGFNENYIRLQDPEIHLRALLNNLKYEKFYDHSVDCYFRIGDSFKLKKQKKQLIASYLNFVSFFQDAILSEEKDEYLKDLKIAIPKLILSLSNVTIDVVSVYKMLIRLVDQRIIDKQTRSKYIILFIPNSIFRLTKSFVKQIIKGHSYNN